MAKCLYRIYVACCKASCDGNPMIDAHSGHSSTGMCPKSGSGGNFAAALGTKPKKQGDDSAKKRGKSFEPKELKLPNPEEENRMGSAAEESQERRKHAIENIANSYWNSISS